MGGLPAALGGHQRNNRHKKLLFFISFILGLLRVFLPRLLLGGSDLDLLFGGADDLSVHHLLNDDDLLRGGGGSLGGGSLGGRGRGGHAAEETNRT